MRGQGEARVRRSAARWLVVTALIVSVAGAPSTAGAATSWWSDIVNVYPEGESWNYVRDLVLTHDGRTLLVTTGDGEQVRARLQREDGRWHAPSTLFAGEHTARLEALAVVTTDATFVLWSHIYSEEIGLARLDGDTWVQLPALETGRADHFDAVAAPGGHVVAAWHRQGVVDVDIATATFDGVAWSESTGVDHDPVVNDLAVGVAPGGAHVVTFVSAGEPTGSLFGVTFDGSTWSAARRLTAAGTWAEDVQVESTPKGVVAAFMEFPDGDSRRVRAATFSGASWTSTATLATLDRHRHPTYDLAVAPDGSAHVAVAHSLGGYPQRAEIRTSRHVSGSSWTAQQLAVSVEGIMWGHEGPVRLSFGSDGTAILTAPIPSGVVVSLAGPSKPWQEAGLIEHGRGGVGPSRHVIDDDGIVHLLWMSWTGWWSTTGIVMPFDDVPAGLFFSAPVLWAAHNDLTTGVGGTDEFQPHRSITRAEAITTLWRYHGEQSAPASGFEDVAPNAFYTRAVNWARHTGLTTGVGGSNRFEPNRTITRAELVTLLWRLDGSGGAPPGGFVDVAPTAFYARSVNWAKHVGITTGVGGSNRFEPNRDVTRAEAFTFVYRLARLSGTSPTGTAAVGGSVPFDVGADGWNDVESVSADE